MSGGSPKANKRDREGRSKAYRSKDGKYNSGKPCRKCRIANVEYQDPCRSLQQFFGEEATKRSRQYYPYGR